MTRDNLSQIVNTSSVNTSNTYASTWEVLKRKIKQDAAYLKQYGNYKCQLGNCGHCNCKTMCFMN